MGTRIADSALYAHLWGTAELGEVFEERSRIQSWVQILVALAEVQAGLGIVPGQATRDLADAAARESPDLTDTLMALAMKRVGAIAWRDLRVIENQVLTLAAAHRVGSLGFFGNQGLELRKRFCARLGLGEPDVSRTCCRDRPAEFCLLLAMITATLARIGSEVYELQRPEIGELSEGAAPGAVSSITMPHKQNPEAAEHLVTLSRLARANAQVLEGMVAEHERDGRGWKAEWPAFSETCLLTGASLSLAKDLLVVESLPADAGLKAGLLQAAAANGAGSAPGMVDEVVAKTRAARAAEEDRWP